VFALIRKALIAPWHIFLAACTQEHCRLCRRCIDQLGWLTKFGSNTSYLVPPAGLEVAARVGRTGAVCADCWHLFLPVDPIITRYAVSANQFRELSQQLDTERDTLLEDEHLLVVSSGSGYHEPMKKLIRRYKYDKDLLLTTELSCLLINGWGLLSPYVEQRNAILVPVPLHWRRKRQRGYNQSALVAERVGSLLGLRFCERGLSRTRETQPQNKLTKENRQTNIAGAFVGNRKILSGKDVILIDDVCTSGATLAECARQAYRAGARQVCALTIARAIMVHATSTSSISHSDHLVSVVV